MTDDAAAGDRGQGTDRPPGASASPLRDTDLGRFALAMRSRVAGVEPRDVAIGIALFAFAFVVYTLVRHDRTAPYDYFVRLADAFLHGRLGLLDAPGTLNELVPVGGMLFVVYPPMPAVVLAPFVAIVGPGMDQGFVSILFGAFNVVLAWRIALRMAVTARVSLVLALVFGFGTIAWFSAQVGSAWHIAHVIAITFTFLAILVAQRDGPLWLIGALVGATALTRLPMMLEVVFFLAYIVDRAQRETTGAGLIAFGRIDVPGIPLRLRPFPTRRFLRLGAPFIATLAAFGMAFLAYDWARFGSPLETGYTLIPGVTQEWQYAQGLFSLYGIPRTLYAMFLENPAPITAFPWVQPRLLGGLSILLTTPLFLWSIRARAADWFTVGAWLAVGLTLVPILTHPDLGGNQFGFRYAQDIYPFLFLLTIRGLRGRLSFEAWIAIAVGVVVNVWGMGAAYFDWWVR